MDKIRKSNTIYYTINTIYMHHRWHTQVGIRLAGSCCTALWRSISSVIAIIIMAASAPRVLLLGRSGMFLWWTWCRGNKGVLGIISQLQEKDSRHNFVQLPAVVGLHLVRSLAKSVVISCRCRMM